MSDLALERTRRVSLCEALDRLLATGVVLVGEATISLAQIDLIYVGVQLVVSSIRTTRGTLDEPDDGRDSRNGSTAIGNTEYELPNRCLNRVRPNGSPHSFSNPNERLPPAKERRPPAEPPGGSKETQGLAKLVLTLMKLLHELLERQALRRVEAGDLSLAETERLGVTLMRQAQEIERLRQAFGLQTGDLNLDLGPLGKLL